MFSARNFFGTAGGFRSPKKLFEVNVHYESVGAFQPWFVVVREHTMHSSPARSFDSGEYAFAQD
jgi:hypothetical protein